MECRTGENTEAKKNRMQRKPADAVLGQMNIVPIKQQKYFFLRDAFSPLAENRNYFYFTRKSFYTWSKYYKFLFVQFRMDSHACAWYVNSRTTRININRININPNDYYHDPVIDYYNLYWGLSRALTNKDLKY